MKLKEWYRSHEEEAHKRGALINASFVDDWKGKPKKVFCDLWADWPERFAECDIKRTEEGETETMSLSLLGSPTNKRKIKYFHAEIDGDQANLALGKMPPKARKPKGKKRFAL